MASPSETFASAAKLYCSLIESAPSRERDEFITAAHSALAGLQVVALSLPDAASDGASGPADAKRADREALDRLLGLRYAYVPDVLDDEIVGSADQNAPFETDARVQVVRLADALADIYDDLADGLSLNDTGRKSDASWHWRSGYLGYWGQSLIGAQSAMWEYLAIDYGVPDEDEDGNATGAPDASRR